jgi:hypothetical protein
MVLNGDCQYHTHHYPKQGIELMKKGSFVNAFDLENHRSCPVIATSYHHFFVFGPVAHDGTSLKRGVYISADAVPCLGTELTVQHFEKILRVDDEHLPIAKKRAFSSLRVGQILIDQIRKIFSTQNGNFAFVLH